MYTGMFKKCTEKILKSKLRKSAKTNTTTS